MQNCVDLTKLCVSRELKEFVKETERARKPGKEVKEKGEEEVAISIKWLQPRCEKKPRSRQESGQEEHEF